MSSLELRPTLLNSRYWEQPRPPKGEWEKIRKVVLDRDDHTCQFCGHRALSYMNLHHLEGAANNSPANLITTCVACHAVLHFGRNLSLQLIEILASDISQLQIVQTTRAGIAQGLTLEKIKERLPLKNGPLPPDSVSYADDLLLEIGDRPTIFLPEPLCVVFVNLKRWQIT